MSITPEQKKKAEQQQWNAARDGSVQVQVVAGPGTGKTFTIQKRVLELLKSNCDPETIYVITFSRTTSAELSERIQAYCSQNGFDGEGKRIKVSTMHSLGLSILVKGNQLMQYPNEPRVLDYWEQTKIFDAEFSSSVSCTPTRAKAIRAAYDAQWSTLNPAFLDEADINENEKKYFTAFHGTRTNLYNCILPGEIIFKCVEALEHGSLSLSQLPTISHLIVDEYQDLNDCDQKFVSLLCQRGTRLFVVGDDDQSIYMSLRHANPLGLVHFQHYYPQSVRHTLTDCFRCAPNIIGPAKELVEHNIDRLDKDLQSLYETAFPPVYGSLSVWSFHSANEEARAIAESCQLLIELGMAGQEDEIIILTSNKRVQLGLIAQELGNLGLPFDAPAGETLTMEEVIRAAFSILRIKRDQIQMMQDIPDREKKLDYPSYRSLLCLLSGVGPKTAIQLSTLSVSHNQNFHDLFYCKTLPHWLTGAALKAVLRVRNIAQQLEHWLLDETIENRMSDISILLRNEVFTNTSSNESLIQQWENFASELPRDMTLLELIEFFDAKTESEQQTILDLVRTRLGIEDKPDVQKKIRILTMHGAKGLSGKIVFIPSVEQGLIPSERALRAPGLVMEQRRLFYVSLTRAKAACIISHAARHTGPQAFALQQRAEVYLPRSQYLNDMKIRSENRSTGLTMKEGMDIISDINNL